MEIERKKGYGFNELELGNEIMKHMLFVKSAVRMCPLAHDGEISEKIMMKLLLVLCDY